MTNEQLIFDTAISDGMPETLARLIVAQSKLETGNYKHRFYTVGKNAFGYSADKNSKWQSKPGSKADNGIPIAQYASVNNSVHELTDWIKRRQKDGKFPKDLTTIKTAEKYGGLLYAAHYGGTSAAQYIAGILTYLKGTVLELSHKPGTMIIALVFLIAILLLIS